MHAARNAWAVYSLPWSVWNTTRVTACRPPLATRALQSAGTRKGGSTGKGNPWLAATLGEVVVGLSRTNTFLGDRYRRLARRRGKKRALVAVGNSVLTILWHLLSEPDSRFHDLGADYYQSQITTRRRQRDLIRQREHLTGQTVVLRPTA